MAGGSAEAEMGELQQKLVAEAVMRAVEQWVQHV